jgi:tRNA U38,U39,U40 pseudouridine synthase TruA
MRNFRRGDEESSIAHVIRIDYESFIAHVIRRMVKVLSHVCLGE